MLLRESDTTVTIGTAGTDEPLIKIASKDSGGATWNISTYSFVSEGTTDNVYHEGYNMDAAGGPVVANTPVIGRSFESSFKLDGETYSEENHEFVSPTGSPPPKRRYASFTVRHSDNLCAANFLGEISVQDSASSAFRFVIEDNATTTTNINVGDWQKGVVMRFRENNYDVIQQRNAANNAYVSLLKLDSSDVLQVVGSGNTAQLNGRVIVAVPVLDFLDASAKPGFWLKAPAHTRLFNNDYQACLVDGGAHNLEYYQPSTAKADVLLVKPTTYSGNQSGGTLAQASTLRISGPPATTGGNLTITAKRSLQVDSGISEFDGQVGVGGAPDAAAALDVASTTQGFLPPRMTTTQRNAISSPPAGLMIYNSSTNKLNFYNGSAWEVVTSA